MMTIFIGISLLALLLLGLYRRKKADKAWIKAERFEESGDWLDKRPGERGTFGVLDELMETERQSIARQRSVGLLALGIQKWCFDQGYFERGLDSIRQKDHLECVKSEVSRLLEWVELYREPSDQGAVLTAPEAGEAALNLKKWILNALYEQFPDWLSFDLDKIKALDERVAQMAESILKTTISI